MRRNAGPISALLICLMVLTLVIVFTGTTPSDNSDPSSTAAGKSGTLALYNWLDELGFDVHRIGGDFDLSGSDVAVIYAPTQPITDADAQTIVDHLHSGGDLILALDGNDLFLAQPLLQRLGVSADFAGGAQGSATPLQPFDVADRVHQVAFPDGALGLHGDIATVPLLGMQGADVTVATSVPGGGHAYILGGSFPLSNDGLRDADDSMLALSLLERSRGGRIGFDEFHHGDQSLGGAGGAGAIFDGPLGLALLLGVAVVIVFMALHGRRLGRPLPARDPLVVPSAAEYVRAMAGLYTRSHRRGAVAGRFAAELKRRIGALSGVDARLDDEGFAAALQRRGGGPVAPTVALLQRARALAATAPSEAELLALARDLDSLEQSWREPSPVEASAAGI